MSEHTIMYYQDTDEFIVRLRGELRFFFAPALERVLSIISCSSKRYKVIIDMRAIPYIDSTMLGTLINFFVNERNKAAILGLPRIWYDNEDIARLLAGMGIDKFFDLQQTSLLVEESLENYKIMDEKYPDKKNLEKLIKQSHATLDKIQLNTDYQLVNKAFKD